MRGYVVNEDGAGGAAVVGARDGAKAFGAGCVPELGEGKGVSGVLSEVGVGEGGEGDLLGVLSVSFARRCRP